MLLNLGLILLTKLFAEKDLTYKKAFEMAQKGRVKEVIMEVDTDSAVSIVSETEYNLLKHLQLRPTHIQLKTFSGEHLPLLGEIQVVVKYQTQEVMLPLVVAPYFGGLPRGTHRDPRGGF